MVITKVITSVVALNKAVKPFACGSLGHSALRACSGMASPFFPDQALHAECRLPRRYMLEKDICTTKFKEVG